MDTVDAISYAKINLTLDVLSVRPDGYHEIDSVVQVIDLADELRVSGAPRGTVEVEVIGDAAVPCGPDNLVYKACAEFLRATGIDGGATCILHKRIPAQAGLGGGSGNAAAAVAALNRLYSAQMPVDRLVEMAAVVGSDAALFLHGGTVRMRGRGEDITELPDAPPLQLVIVKPDVGVPTAWAYSELDRRGLRGSSWASDVVEAAIRSGDRELLLRSLANDFDAVVTEKSAPVAAARSRLLGAGAETALLAGSGAAVFGVFPDRRAAETARDVIARDWEHVYLAAGLTRQASRLL